MIGLWRNGVEETDISGCNGGVAWYNLTERGRNGFDGIGLASEGVPGSELP